MNESSNAKHISRTYIQYRPECLDWLLVPPYVITELLCFYLKQRCGWAGPVSLSLSLVERQCVQRAEPLGRLF